MDENNKIIKNKLQIDQIVWIELKQAKYIGPAIIKELLLGQDEMVVSLPFEVSGDTGWIISPSRIIYS